MLNPIQYFLCWASGGGQGAVVVGWDPVGDRGGDVAVISPADGKVAIVGELHIAGGRLHGNNRWMTWSCHLVVKSFVGWLFFGQGRASQNTGLGSQAEGEGEFSL